MKHRFSPLLAIIVLSTFLISTITSAATNKDDVLATVNGKKITAETLALYAIQRDIPPGKLSPKLRKALIEELINRELIYQDAVSLGVDKTPEIMARVEHQRINIIASTMISRSSDRFAVSEDEIKKEYEARKGELGGKEFKARHILLNSENEAKDIIAKLDKGEDFSELAKKYSTGPSAGNGGDLGWFSEGEMVKPFSEAASKLAKGSYTKQPVKTQFGWHVILLDDTRMVDPPSFDSIKEQILVGLQNRLIEKYIADLREKAKITQK